MITVGNWRYDDAAGFALANTVFAAGVITRNIGTRQCKRCDGSTAWNSILYEWIGEEEELEGIGTLYSTVVATAAGLSAEVARATAAEAAIGTDASDYVDAQILALTTGAPGALDTLNELAAALGDDENFAATMTTALAGKETAGAAATVNSALTTHTSNTFNPHSVTKAQVGLSNADNTSDANKPVSTAQATADTAIGTAAASDATTKSSAAQAAAIAAAASDATTKANAAQAAAISAAATDATTKANAAQSAAATDATTKANAAKLTLTEVEKNLGSTPAVSGTFDITGLSGLTADKQVLMDQKVAAYTGKGTLSDEVEMDTIDVRGYVLNATTIRAYWKASSGVVGNFKFGYQISA